LAQSPEFTIVIGGPQGFSATGSATAVPPGISNSRNVSFLTSVTSSPPVTTSVTTPTAGSTNTSPGNVSSIGNTAYEFRGLAIAMAIIGVGLTAMFVV
jgi:hypothetical protein